MRREPRTVDRPSTRSVARSALIEGLIPAVVVAGAALFALVTSEQSAGSEAPIGVPAPSLIPPVVDSQPPATIVPSYSYALGILGGGQMPQQAIHAIGTDLEDQLGTPVSSGSIHVSTETVERMADLDLLGARVILYDSTTGISGRDVIERAGWHSAETKPIDQASAEQPIGAFT